MKCNFDTILTLCISKVECLLNHLPLKVMYNVSSSMNNFSCVRLYVVWRTGAVLTFAPAGAARGQWPGQIWHRCLNDSGKRLKLESSQVVAWRGRSGRGRGAGGPSRRVPRQQEQSWHRLSSVFRRGCRKVI